MNPRVLYAAIAVVVFMAGGFVLGLSAADLTSPPSIGLPDFHIKPRHQPKRSVATLDRADPVRITIGSIKVDAPIDQMGLADDGTLEVPDLDVASHTGWYSSGPSPGERGAAVVVGHVDSRSRPAVFHNLHKLRYGDEIHVHRSDGVIATFTVQSGTIYHKKSFPSTKVYTAPDATLRLVTCGGRWEAKRDSYTHNIVVFATLARTAKT